jgi:regulator of replication initiation timing/transposase
LQQDNYYKGHKINIFNDILLAIYILLCYTLSVKGSDILGGNYGRDLFRQLQETIVKVEKLSTEISDLKNENQKLEKRIEVLEKENTALKSENQQLKDIINKDSGNSSKPPSSDGFNKINNSREKSGKRPGGQPGHKGCVPKLFDNPTRTVDIKPERCECGGRIKYSGKYALKQVVDISINTDITEYREYEGVCECCRNKAENRAPVDYVITYGSNLKGLSAMLTTEGCISINRTRQMISELTGGLINLSEGTIVNWNKELAGCVAPAIENIKEKLMVSPVLNKDETGVRVDKTINWFHVLANRTHTLYHADKKRGNDADKEMGILPSYGGVLIHDHLRGLYDFTCGHAECNAHILRYLKAAIESKNRNWAKDMIKLLLEAKGGMDADKVLSRYDEILDQGQREFLKDETPDYNGEDMKLLRRMKKYKQEHLRFVTDKNVPFDNNQAERDLRMIKAKTKISGCFRGDDKGGIFAALKSYTSTLRKNNRNIFNGIKSAFLFKPVIC